MTTEIEELHKLWTGLTPHPDILKLQTKNSDVELRTFLVGTGEDATTFKAFYRDGHRLHGLTSTMNECIFHGRTGFVSRGGKRCGCPSHGMSHGRTIHSQISRDCNTIWQKDAKIRKRKVPRWKCTVRFLRFLTFMKWVPVASELPVACSRRWAMGTAHDLWVEESYSRKLIYIQIKCDSTSTFEGNPRTPLLNIEDYRDCPLDHAKLQTLSDLLLGGVLGDEAYVVRITAARVVWYRVHMTQSIFDFLSHAYTNFFYARKKASPTS